jgi:hypothetical protein
MMAAKPLRPRWAPAAARDNGRRSTMSLAFTIAVLTAAAVLFGGATILARRPVAPGEVRLVPWGAVQFLALLVLILMAAHLVSLLTGKTLESRYFR